MKKTILLGVSSGIAAYKSLELVSLLKSEGVEVKVIMTHHAQKMIALSKFEEASHQRVFSDLFPEGFDYAKILAERKVEHIDLADSADLMVIAPATANIIAKLAHGMADDYLTTVALAVTAPIIVCPSMNVNMWNNPVVQENIEKLAKIGIQIIEPEVGMLACGYEGKGRLASIQKIKDEVLVQINKRDSLKGKKIIVTAGGTVEKIDDVRCITNRSSGKMGVAIAEECYLRGADVLLLRAKNAVQPRYLLKEELFSSSEELLALVEKYAPAHDIFFHAAAVSDFQVSMPKKGKISSKKSITLKLVPQKKIIDQVKKIHPKIVLIAFKAEYNLSEKKLIQVARKKIKESCADVVIANDVSQNDRGFESDSNEVIVVLASGEVIKILLTSKREVAAKMIDYLSEYVLL